MVVKNNIKLTANFEHNLEEIKKFLLEAENEMAFNALLDELISVVIPNLELFPNMGRSFLDLQGRSIDTSIGLSNLIKQLNAIAINSTLREYVLSNYLILYANINNNIYLLSIRHHKQLSFNLTSHWLLG